MTVSGTSSDRWTYEQAGEHCGGITSSTYRSYVSRQGAPAADRYDPDTGRKTIDAEAVRRWYAARPGRGARTDLQAKKSQSD
jgi:hypothetical protein